MARILLGLNCNCFTNRYTEPEEWTRICHELGINYVMFNVDLIDPYWPWNLQRQLCDRTLKACKQYNITITSSFGGQHGHQHYLGHPLEQCRREAEHFFKRAIQQTAYLGGKSFGTCFAIKTVLCENNPALRRKVLEDAIESYCRLAEYGAKTGIKALSYEMTSVPRETCATFAENDYILDKCSSMAIPMRICLDLGHRNLDGSEEEANHLSWIKRYGQFCDVIDCQQTDRTASRHWPFTEEYNRKGIIKGGEVIAAINESKAGEILLALEIKTPAFHPREYTHLENIKQSIAYWRQWVRD